MVPVVEWWVERTFQGQGREEEPLIARANSKINWWSYPLDNLLQQWGELLLTTPCLFYQSGASHALPSQEARKRKEVRSREGVIPWHYQSIFGFLWICCKPHTKFLWAWQKLRHFFWIFCRQCHCWDLSQFSQRKQMAHLPVPLKSPHLRDLRCTDSSFRGHITLPS